MLLGIIFFRASTDSCQERGWFSGSISNHFSSSQFLSIFLPLFFIYCQFSSLCTQRTGNRTNEWKAKDSIRESLEMCTVSALMSSKEECPSSEATEVTAFIPSYLCCALSYKLHVLPAQVLCTVNNGLMRKLYFYLYKFLNFIMFSTKHWMEIDLAQRSLFCLWGFFFSNLHFKTRKRETF